MQRTTLSHGLTAVILVIGLAASVVVFLLSNGIESERISKELELQVAWRAMTIENSLTDGLLPLSALAIFMASKPVPDEAQFLAVAARARTLGVPVGRLLWAPVIQADRREALEQEIQSNGHPGFRIKAMNSAGSFVAAPVHETYAPVVYELL